MSSAGVLMKDLPSPPAADSFVEQLKTEQFFRYVARTSTNLTDSSAASTNILTEPDLKILNKLIPGQPRKF